MAADRLLYSIEDARMVLGGMARSTLYTEVSAGRIATVKIGRRTYIARDELERYVATLSKTGESDA